MQHSGHQIPVGDQLNVPLVWILTIAVWPTRTTERGPQWMSTLTEMDPLILALAIHNAISS